MPAEIDRHVASPASGWESVVGRFERQVDAHPLKDAVHQGVDTGTTVTSFRQLDAWANAIAWKLIARRGTRPEPIPLLVCAPDLMLAAALGVLKAGKFYAAVNPTHPKARRDGVLSELDPALTLCDRGGLVADPSSVPSLQVEEIIAESVASERPALALDEGRLAYVLYTSGSTGRPRGVAHSRRDMLHNLNRHRPLGINRADRVSLISADGFVASISNPYMALTEGATLAPYSFWERGVEGMETWLQGASISVLYMFPSFLRPLAALEHSWTHPMLRLAYLGGEPVMPSDLATARRLFPRARLSVGLNSSETGLTCLHSIAPGSPLPRQVPVGRPVLDVRVRIVDDRGRPLPPESPGEIEIDSDYVKPLVWHDANRVQAAERTAALTEPTAALSVGKRTARLRTGDRGRFDADGVLYHLGRSDGMVKVRGFRVELAEVEAAIAALPGVSEVVVSVRRDSAETTQLIAHIVPASGGSVEARRVRRALFAELPPAMIPARIFDARSLPRTPNGKLDRVALAKLAATQPTVPSPDTRAAVSSTGGARRLQVPQALSGPASSEELERRIARIWCAVLERDRVGADDDFFALGGTSIDAVLAMAQIRRQLGAHIPLRALFKTPTMRAIAQAALALRDDGERPHAKLRRRLARAGKR